MASGSGTNNFNYSSSTPFFAVEEDDIDDNTFLKNSRNFGNDNIEQRRQQLLNEKRMIEERTVASSMRSISLLQESEDIGIQTAGELATQREQLENVEQKLDDINSSLRMSERHIRGIKSIFGGIKNYFSGGKNALPQRSSTMNPGTLDPLTEQDSESSTPSIPKSPSDPDTDKLRSAASPSTSVMQNQLNMIHSPSADEILDHNLGIMADSLSRLKGLGLDLQDEIIDQNEMVGRITTKTENVDHRIKQQNLQMNKILKK